MHDIVSNSLGTKRLQVEAEGGLCLYSLVGGESPPLHMVAASTQ